MLRPAACMKLASAYVTVRPGDHHHLGQIGRPHCAMCSAGRHCLFGPDLDQARDWCAVCQWFFPTCLHRGVQQDDVSRLVAEGHSDRLESSKRFTLAEAGVAVAVSTTWALGRSALSRGGPKKGGT